MSNDLSKSQRIILLYIGITSKIEKKESLSKKEIEDGLSKELDENLDTKSLNSLVRKNMLEEHDDSFNLSDDGKDIARELLQDVKDKYGDADWDIIKKYFDEQTIKPLHIDKWIREFQKLPESIQNNITHLSENIKRKKSVSQLTKEFIEILNTDNKVRKIIDDRFKYNTVLTILSNRYTPKTVDLEEILHKEPLEKDELKILERIAKNNFRSQNLMFMLKREFDKDHVGDSKGKLSAFLVCCSGKLQPKYRVSMALRGDSSVGKTNLMKTALRHLPKHWYAFGTRFTRATLEDDVEPFYIIAFSEKTQDDPAVIESLKQLTEDGLQTWKHDKESNKLRDVKFIDRKSSLYSSTEKETDEELATRYIVYTVTRHPYKINRVIESIKNKYSDVEKLFEEEKREKKPTWITVGLQQLEDFDKIIIPFSKFICFSDDYPRCQRDVKRFLNLIAVCAWLNQYNRYRYEKDGKKILVASADDFFWIAFLTVDIFKQTLSNIDKDIEILISTYDDMILHRKNVILTEKSDEAPLNRRQLIWVRRSDLLKELNISLNTLKKRCNVLKEKGVLTERSEKRGSRSYIAIDTEPLMIHLMKYGFEKMYFVMKNIESDFLNKLPIKFTGKYPSIRNSIAYKNIKYKPKLNFSLDSKGRLLTKTKKVDEDIQEMIRYINKSMLYKKILGGDFSVDEFFDESEVEWEV